MIKNVFLLVLITKLAKYYFEVPEKYLL